MIAYAHRAHAFEEDSAVDGIAISDQVSQRLLLRECLGQLSSHPLRCGMRRCPYRKFIRRRNDGGGEGEVVPAEYRSQRGQPGFGR